MRFFRFNFIFLLIILSSTTLTTLLGVDVKSCYIKDPFKHEANQKLLNSILDREFSYLSDTLPADQAIHLSESISKITKALVKGGFSADAYEVPEIDQNSITSFNCFTLWEGNKKVSGAIPLTFFVYVWPSEGLATCASKSLNASIIHSHPIPCAFAVLKGTLVQKKYELVTSSSLGNSIRFIDETIFCEGEGDIDALRNQFIHKLCNKSSSVCLSLHAYGLPSSDEVMACFRDTESTCSYERSIVN